MHRGWRDCDAFEDAFDPMSDADAWFWLIEHAAWKPMRRRGGQGQPVTVGRGQIHISDRSLATAFRWDKKRVRRFLDRLEAHEMVTFERDQSGTILTICNYDKYQSANDDEGPVKDQSGTTQEQGKQSSVDKSTSEKRRRASIGTRLPDDWKPEKLSRDTVSGQIIQHRGQDWAKRTLETFHNHWLAKSGKDGRKDNWQAAWANWVIEQDRRDGRNGRSGFQQSEQTGLGRTARAAIEVFGHPDDDARESSPSDPRAVSQRADIVSDAYRTEWDDDRGPQRMAQSGVGYASGYST